MGSQSPTPPSLSPTPHPGHLSNHPPQPQSKRDKRRNALSDRLNHLTKSFHNPNNPRTRDAHYRGQLASLQADIQLVTRADVSGREMRLQDDSGERVQRQVEDVLAKNGMRVEEVNMEGMAGQWYAQYLEACNDAMEERDTQLVLLYNHHRTKAASLTAQHTRSLIHAREEHKSLASTIQGRLSNRLKSQLKKLAVEKESSSISANALSGGLSDIHDSNALNLHPSHFGLNVGAGSPRRHGGTTYDDDTEKETSLSRRKRRRAGEVEELMAFGVGMNYDSPGANGKRKRRGAADADDVPTSPALAAALEPNSPSSGMYANLEEATRAEKRRKQEELLTQVYAPIYSLEKLFTEKELQMHSNQATVATFRFFSDHAVTGRDANPENATAADDNDSAAPTSANTPAPGNNTGDDDDVAEDGRAIPAAGGRGLSPLSELTRGLPSLPSFAGVNTRSNPPRQFSKEMETLVLGGVPGAGMTYVNKAGIAPAPPGIKPEEVEADLLFLRRPTGGREGGSKRKRGN